VAPPPLSTSLLLLGHPSPAPPAHPPTSYGNFLLAAKSTDVVFVSGTQSSTSPVAGQAVTSVGGSGLGPTWAFLLGFFSAQGKAGPSLLLQNQGVCVFGGGVRGGKGSAGAGVRMWGCGGYGGCMEAWAVGSGSMGWCVVWEWMYRAAGWKGACKPDRALLCGACPHPYPHPHLRPHPHPTPSPYNTQITPTPTPHPTHTHFPAHLPPHALHADPEYPSLATIALAQGATLQEVDPGTGQVQPGGVWDDAPTMPGLQLSLQPGDARLFVVATSWE
jgi:hypothetical protein